MAALKELRNNSAINLKKADKGTTTVIMNKSNKMQEAEVQLENREHYKPLEAPMVNITQTKVNQIIDKLVGGGGGDRGAGARENRGREGYGRREREGRDGGDLRGREAGEKCETLIILIQQCVTKLLKSRNQNMFDLHLTSSQSLLRLLSKRANENLRLG